MPIHGRILSWSFDIRDETAYVFNIYVHLTLISQVTALQYEDLELRTIGMQMVEGMNLEGWSIHTDSGVWYLGRIGVPNDDNL